MTPLKVELNISMLHGSVANMTKKLEDAEKRIESLEDEVRRLNRTVFPLDQWNLP
jgi:archaellum component FlaC